MSVARRAKAHELVHNTADRPQCSLSLFHWKHLNSCCKVGGQAEVLGAREGHAAFLAENFLVVAGGLRRTGEDSDTQLLSDIRVGPWPQSFEGIPFALLCVRATFCRLTLL